jgi:hypothetical protein
MSNIWGRPAWFIFHLITYTYPENPTLQDRENYQMFFQSFGRVLPCPVCRANFERHYRAMPLTQEILDNRNSLVRWGIDMHNMVNQELGKRMLGHQEAEQAFEKWLRKKAHRRRKWTFLWIIIIMVILIFLTVWLFQKFKS